MKNPDKKGLIFDIQRQCIHDGDGVRTVLFMKGCPLRCAWCANPESQEMKVELAFLPQTCIGDGACVLACRKDAVKAPGVIARNLCIYCGECTKVCYAEALSLIGEWIDPEEACDRLLRDFVFFQRSGGRNDFRWRAVFSGKVCQGVA